MADIERKEVMEGKNPSPDLDDVDELYGPKIASSSSSSAKPSVTQTWVQPRVQKELSSSEFLELLRMQREVGQFRSARIMTTGVPTSPISQEGSFYGSSSNSQSIHTKDGNQDYESVAIDQCDITSSVDYGSRDYYRPSTRTSANPHIYKEDETDELDMPCTDTRGNWWQGSFYY